MANPYSKLFNVFALSVLALAVYINFVHPSDAPASQKNRLVNYHEATTDAKTKPATIADNRKISPLKEDRKN